MSDSFFKQIAFNLEDVGKLKSSNKKFTNVEFLKPLKIKSKKERSLDLHSSSNNSSQ